MLMELAELRPSVAFSSSSSNACFTSAWQASKSPSIATVSILPPRVQNSFSCSGLDLAARIEDHDLDVRQAVESMRHRRPGVARGRGEDGDRLIACDVGQHLRHKAAAEILERQRRAMEQLQTADIFLNLADRRRKRKRRAHPPLQDILRISSPIKADKILALRVTKSCASMSSISVRLNSGRLCGRTGPDACQVPG